MRSPDSSYRKGDLPQAISEAKRLYEAASEMGHLACRAAREAVAVARNFRTDLPHALREIGLISALRGFERQARQYLDESLVVAQRQGAWFESAQTLLARGSVGLLTRDWPGAAKEIAQARQALTDLGADFAYAICVPIDEFRT